MNIWKKWISLSLALAMVLTVLPTAAFAQESTAEPEVQAEIPAEAGNEDDIALLSIVASGTCGDNVSWSLDDAGTLTISGTGEMSSAPWEAYKEQIIQVMIDEGVTSVQRNAFYQCTNLKTASLPSTLKVLGRNAFGVCVSLKELKLPEGLETLETMACSDCSSLTTINIPGTVTDWGSHAIYGSFAGCSLTDLTLGEGLTMLPQGVFMSAGLTALELPSTMQTIGEKACYNNPGLTKVAFPDSVQTIEANAFDECSNLTDVVIGKGIKTIGSQAFISSALPFVVIAAEEGTVDIAVDAFPASTKIVYSATLPAVVYSGTCGDSVNWSLDDAGTLTISGTGEMYDYASGNTPWYGHRNSITKVVVESGVTKITDYAFTHYYSLKTVALPEGLTEISKGMFQYCDDLSTINLPNSIKRIGYSAFSGCDKLTSITIPQGVTYVGGWAFYGCGGLLTVTIPQSVTELGDYVFAYCDSLTKAVLPEGITIIPQDMFSQCTSLSDVNIPASVEQIGYGAFYGCPLPVVTLGDKVKTIGQSAFAANNSLTAVTIGSGITNIGAEAFAYCPYLRTVSINKYSNSVTVQPDSFPGTAEITYAQITPDTVLGEWKLGRNGATATLYGDYRLVIGGGEDIPADACDDWDESAIKKIIIQDDVVTIGDSAFYKHTALTEVTIGKGVEEIDSQAFYGCSALTKVTVDAVKADVSVAADAFYNCHADLQVTFTDGNLDLSAVDGGPCGEDGSDDIIWQLDSNGVLTLTGTGEMSAFDDNKSNRAPWYSKRKSVTSLVIGEGITSISDGAFQMMSELKKVSLPSTLTEIGSEAFTDCIALTSIDIPDKVHTIGDAAFCACERLCEVTIGTGIRTIGADAFVECSEKISIKVDAPAYLVDAEDWVDDDAVVTWAEGDPDEIVSQWYVGTDKETDVQATLYGDGRLVFTGEGAIRDFDGKKGGSGLWGNVTAVEVGAGVTNVSALAFYDNPTLTSVTLGPDVTVIGDDAFWGCGELEEVDLANVTEIGSYAFAKTGLKEVTLGKGVQLVRKSAFYACPRLSTIRVLGETRFNGADIFANCPVLSEIEWHDGWISNAGESSIFHSSGHKDKGIVLTIGAADVDRSDYMPHMENIFIPANMFYTSTLENEAPNLVKVQAAEGARVWSVGEFAFYNCPDLEEVDLGDHLHRIEESAFRGCSGLTELYLGWNVRTIEQSAFAEHGKAFQLHVFEGSDAHTYAVENDLPFVLRADAAGFAIDGTKLQYGVEASGSGWTYDGYTTVTLENYTGGSISVPGGFRIDAVGENTVNGSISSEGALEIYPTGSLTVNSSAEPAIKAADLTVNGVGGLTVNSTGEVAIQAGFVRFFGGSTVTVTAAEVAVKGTVQVDNHTIYLAEIGKSAKKYDGGPYLRLKIDTYFYTLHANGGRWADVTGSVKTVELPVITRLDPNQYASLLSREGYLLVGWEQDDERLGTRGDIVPGNMVSALWAKDVLLIGETEYDSGETASGDGWSFTPASGDTAASLVITAEYDGAPISFSEKLDVTITGPLDITSPAGTPVLKTLGKLKLDLYGSITLRGGAGANCIEAVDGVDLNNYGKTAIYGGEGGAGICNEHLLWYDNVKLRSKDQLTIVGGLRACTIEGMVSLSEHEGGTITLIAGPEAEGISHGWHILTSSTVKLYAGSNINDLRRYSSLSDCIDQLCIRVQPKTILVNYDANGGTIDQLALLSADVPQDENNAFTLQSASLPKQLGHRFVGWNTAADGSGETYAEGETYTAEEDQDSVTLFAQWEKLDFDAQFNEAGDQALVTIAQEVADDAVLMLVAYSGDGQMLQMAFGQRSDQQWIFDVTNDPDVADWTLFQVSSDYAPQTDARDVAF